MTDVLDRPGGQVAIAEGAPIDGGQIIKEKVRPPKGDALFKAVALALEARGAEVTAGIEALEHQEEEIVLETLVDGTVFRWIREELRDLGIQGDLNTIGAVMTGLGIVGGEDGVFDWDGTIIDDKRAQFVVAHEIGCDCHGPEITASQAAARVREYITEA